MELTKEAHHAAGGHVADRRTGRPTLAAIVVLTIAVRVIWAAMVPISPVSDAAMYHFFAKALAAGQGYILPDGTPTVYWPVGPAAFYAPFYRVLGDGGASVVLANVLLSGLLVVGIHRLGMARFSRTVADIAALIFALWPMWIEFTTFPNSELPFATLLVWGLVVRPAAGLKPVRAVVLSTAVSTALLIGAAFMRPVALPLIVLIPLLDAVVALRSTSVAQVAMRLLIAVLVAGALLAPWAERNRALFGEPVLISANFGVNLWMGNNAASDGGYTESPDPGIANDVERNAYYVAKAVEFIRNNPAQYIGLCIKRIKLSFDRETIGVVWNEASLDPAWHIPLKTFSTLYWLAVFAASLGGVGLFLRERPMNLFDPLIAAPAMFAAIAVLVVGQDRYHMPMMPFVALFAALLIERVIRRGSAPNTRPA